MFSKIKKQLQPKIKTLGSVLAKTPLVMRMLENLGFRDYDLPLAQSEDSRFLVLLIALMSFLSVLACSGTFALNDMAARWSSGLENKVTIEIAVETKDGHLLSNKTVRKETKKLAKGLKNNPMIKSLAVLSNAEIQELISPWIGDSLTLNDIPLPGLIAIELRNTNQKSLNTLKSDMLKLSKYARLETHHEWLGDLINFTRTLKNLSLFITLIIASVTIIAITAGIRTRLAIHQKEVCLLHAMGATDHYIARQFQRHAMILSLKGGLVGTVFGLVTTAIIIFLSSHSGTTLIPTIKISSAGLALLCLIPIIASTIATITSRFTVLRNLSKIP
ncbi:MAG: permease [Alphaproteobacteria bacterium]|nr:MAG: permease [Alphaproteobacteria bacterium]